MSIVYLLLVGRTGNGKSSTGNSILGRNAFTPRSSSSSVTDDISKGSAQIDGKTVTVVDGPGLGDTGFDDYMGVESAIAMARKALSFFSTGFHALLIVLKYGVRFTKQEKDAIQMIKSIFGEDIVKNHGIIVMTYGDSFDLDVEDEGTTFEDWCREQTGDVQALFRECNQRCVLFNNKTKDSGKLKEQYNKLMSKVDNVLSHCDPYTMEAFRRAESGRTRLTVVSQIPMLQKENDEVLRRIEQEVQKLEGQPHLTPKAHLQELEKLRSGLEQHKADLQRRDQETGSLNQLLVQISVTEMSIKTKIDLCKRTIDQEFYQRAMQRNREEHSINLGGDDDDDDERHPPGIYPGRQRVQRKTLGIAIIVCVVCLSLMYYFFFYQAAHLEKQ